MNISQSPPADNETGVRVHDDTWQRRDAQAVSSHQVHFTNPDEFIEEVQADHRRGWITDRIVRLAITSRPATLGEIDGTREAGDERISLYDAKHVECSYLARGQLVKLSRFCGTSAPPDQHGARAVAITQATAEAVMSTLHKLQAALTALDGLDVRGGGLYVETGNWRAAADQTITAPPTPTCATCGTAIHFANNAWRGADAADAVIVDTGHRRPDGRPIKQLDHVHDPEVVGRKV